MAATDKLVFVPSKSVTFMPNGSKQMAEMTVANESDKTIMFKMKSTRPGMFKMRPVYGAVAPSEKTTVRLIFKGLKSGQEAPRKERFTVVAAVAPSTSINTEKVWKIHKYHEKLAEGQITKKKFRILFFGVNDQDNDEEDEKKEAKEAKEKDEKEVTKDNEAKDKETKDKDGKKTINEGDPENEEKGKSVADVIVKKEIVQAPPKKLVVVMYRDQKDDSVSGDDDDDDDPTTTCTTVQQNTNKQQTEKTNPERRQQQSNVATKSAAQKSTLGGKSAMSATTAAKQGDQQTNREATKSAAVTQKSVLTKSMTTSELNVKTAKLSPAFDIKKVKAEVAANVPAARVQSFTVDPDDAGAKTCQQNKAFNNNQQSEYAK